MRIWTRLVRLLRFRALTGVAAIGLALGLTVPCAASAAGSVRFTVATDDAVRVAPLVQGGTVYLGDSGGLLQALDARTGTLRWRFRAGGAIASAPASDGTRIFFASRDGVLHALDAKTGARVWSLAVGADLGSDHYWDYFLSSASLHGGTLFIGAGDGRLRAIAAGTGRLLWSHDAGARIRTTPAVGDGRVVFGTQAGHVVALHERDGRPAWDFATEGAGRTFDDRGNDTTSVASAPTIAAGSVFVGGRDGFLYALDLASGRERWRRTHDGSSWILATASDGRRLYVGSGSALIVQAVDPASGEELWRAPTRGAVFASLALGGDAVVYADFSGTLQALDAATGRALWQFPMGGRGLAAPVLADGAVFAASDQGVLYAIEVAGAVRSAADGRRIAFRAGPATAKSFTWFQNGVDLAILEQLRGAGYEAMDTPALSAFLRGYAGGTPPAVVVFTDNRIPAALAVGERSAGTPPIRRFLDAGGKVVLLGPNPLAYLSDPETDELTAIDFAAPRRVFGVPYAEPREVGGYYPSRPTEAGRRAGLRHSRISVSALPSDDGVTPLARDEFGRPSLWQRSYGGPPGSGLLQLGFSRSEMPDIAELRAVIEHGVSW